MSEELTVKQRLFCKAYLANGYNATQAAISAGYSENCAQEIGSENLSKPLIRTYLDRELKKVEDKFDITREWKMQKLKRCAELAMPEIDGQEVLENHNALLGAISELNKMQGHYSEKKEIEDKLDEMQEKLTQLVNENKKEY